jgi:hypothetical protein
VVNQSVLVDGVSSEESLPLHNGAVVMIVPRVGNARLMSNNVDEDSSVERDAIERTPVKRASPRTRPQSLNRRTPEPSSIDGDEYLTEKLIT